MIEAHPDNELPDLRLNQPFDELKNFCKSIDMSQLSDAEHAHVPYLVILYKYLIAYKSEVLVLVLDIKRYVFRKTNFKFCQLKE